MSTAPTTTIRLRDGYEAGARWWRPERYRGAVLYFHGIQSHGGWYEESGHRLAAAGLNVLMPDRRGSGLNREQRGHAESPRQCIDDARAALDVLLGQTGATMAHLVGVSWGGKLAALLAGELPAKVASLTLIAPGFFPKVDMPALEKMRIALSLVNDRERQFDIPLQDARLFTSNPRRIEYVARDDLKLTQVTAAFLLASRRMDRMVARLAQSPYHGPVHLMLAGRDRIIHNERTRAWLRGLPSVDSRIIEYPDAEHTLEFEADAEAFFSDLVGWIADRSARPSLPNDAAR